MQNSKVRTILLALLTVLTACQASPPTPVPPDATVLTVQGPEIEKEYALEDLHAMEITESESEDGEFVGVQLSALLADAGFDLDQIDTVRALATDGFSSTYQGVFFTREDVIVAYKRKGGALNPDELPLRVVAPGEEGLMQPRMLSTLEVSLKE